MQKRVILIVLDSVGIGELPDSADFNDRGSHTLGNICAALGNLRLDNLYSLGLSRIEGAKLPAYSAPIFGAYGRAMEKTLAKDTTSGHWEMCGLILDKPFSVFEKGFPASLISEFEAKIERGVLGNEVASGTEIIARLGDEHVRTRKPIVYTSADSVFQIAAHEDIIPLDELYEMCKTARLMLNKEYRVGRVIARPFKGESGSYFRTENRRDYSMEPPSQTILDALTDKGYTTVGIGKIEDIFARKGISIAEHTKNNDSGIDATIKYINNGTGDLIFTNLVDFDMLYGHRNDVAGYAAALESFDRRLPEIISALHQDDILIITADHGCDPTTISTDHSREYVPVLVYGKRVKPVPLGTFDSFAVLGASAYRYITGERFGDFDTFISRILY